jgi:hypothetical protein
MVAPFQKRFKSDFIRSNFEQGVSIAYPQAFSKTGFGLAGLKLLGATLELLL